MLFGVDVHSVFQQGFNFKDAAAENYRFAFVKASQGETGSPRGTLDFFRRAEASIDVVGLYHFLDATMPGDKQADMFVDVVRRAGGSQGKLLAVDFEPYGGASPTNAQLKGFVRRVKELTDGHPVICYTMHSFWNSGVPSGNPANYDIDRMWEAAVWYADERDRREAPKSFYVNAWKPWYAEQNRLMYDSAPTSFRQFTWYGHVDGMYVDTDAFEGDMDDLLKLTRRA